MTDVGLRRYVLWVGLTLMTACGGPLPEEQEGVEAAPREESAEVVEKPGADLACFEFAEACVPGWRTCEVRCCDGDLDSSYQVCGNCLDWAQGRCSNHGGVRRVRWSP